MKLQMIMVTNHTGSGCRGLAQEAIAPGQEAGDEGDEDGQVAIAPGHGSRNWQPWVRSSAANPKIRVMAAGLQQMDEGRLRLGPGLSAQEEVTVDQLVDARIFQGREAPYWRALQQRGCSPPTRLRSCPSSLLGG